jgi:hypothetical protein
MFLLVFHTYINGMYGSRSKIPSKKSLPYIYTLNFWLYSELHIYDISRLTVNVKIVYFVGCYFIARHVVLPKTGP